MESVNERIAFLIKDLGITRSAFAERLHVSGPFITGVCSGIRNPSNRTVSDICREFNVSLAWLETGEGEMYVQRSENERLALMFADVLAEADYIGSTAGIIKYAEESDASEFIIVTVRGVLYELERRCQGTGKKFYFPAVQPTCVNMDLITLEKLVRCLETGEGEVQIGVSDEAADQAKLTLDRMLEYAAR